MSAILTTGSGTADAAPTASASPDASTLVWLTPEELTLEKAHPGDDLAGAVSATSSVTTMQTAAVQPLDQQGPYVTLYSYSDLRGPFTPIRKGNGSFGYEHYAYAHNLTSPNPIHAAFQTHTPAVDRGAHLEYTALATNPANLKVYLTVRVVVQAAARTDDGNWITPDGKNIGVITAYCEGFTLCPDWVNSVKG